MAPVAAASSSLRPADTSAAARSPSRRRELRDDREVETPSSSRADQLRNTSGVRREEEEEEKKKEKNSSGSHLLLLLLARLRCRCCSFPRRDGTAAALDPTQEGRLGHLSTRLCIRLVLGNEVRSAGAELCPVRSDSGTNRPPHPQMTTKVRAADLKRSWCWCWRR